MVKDNRKHGQNWPPDLKQVKEQIVRERHLYINNTFELRCKPSVAAHVSHHRSLALSRSGPEDSNGIENKLLSLRMKTPLHYFKKVKGTCVRDEVELPPVEFPFVEEIPRSVTWVFTDSNLLMAKTASVYHVHDETSQLNSKDEGYHENGEGTKKEKYKFSKNADLFIWKIGQEYGFNDRVLKKAVTKYLKIDVKELLERYNELIKLNNGKNGGEGSDSSSKSILPSFPDTVCRRYCRRCLMFDCCMHEKHQPKLKSSENISDLFGNEEVREQCSEHCYLKLRNVTEADNVVDNDKSISNTETEDRVIIDTNEVIKDMTNLSIVSEASNEWTPKEKDFYLNGVEIFGRNSCLIAKNLLMNIKTCLEVYNYMCEQDQSTMSLEHNQTAHTENQVNKEVSPKRTRFVRKGFRKFALSRTKSKLACKRLRKSALYPPALKKIARGETKVYRQYTPCTCESICGDQCSCIANGNCCEKYCGCPKSCKNRFQGCNCAIGQCINRQCPCVAIAHECDPDICRSCRLSCRDGSLGEIAEEIQCKNMNFLLKKQKKIMIAKSDIHGWGAFTRYSVKRHDFLGEYTGELVTHDEANERGRKYDHHIGSKYLFSLNNQLEIDAHRFGNKFKFLNHSSKPNCYSKLVIVRGDHRIGIFAGQAIEEGEELFFDYCYVPGQADWCSSSKHRTNVRPKKSKGNDPSST
ncbi:medea [Arabis alpina]|uniref:Medea n=1 Tax=Arabis alpina TaxID=50452 RepID=A0A087HKG4_ARAAL|nr:medea [Arabis alpina]